MALPEIRWRMRAETDQARGEFRRTRQEVDRLGDAGERSGRRVSALSRRISESTSRSRNMGRGIQNAAFQMGDFAVQAGAGTDASRALAMQLPQLLGGFGVLGAVAGALAAIVIPLRTAMQGLAEDGQNVARVFGTLQPAVVSIQTAMASLKVMMQGLADTMVNNIDRIIAIAATAAAVFAGRWVAGFVAARIATFSLAGALVALRGALIRTGIGALIVGAGEMVYQFTRLSSAAGGFGEAMRLLGEVGRDVWQRIVAGGETLMTGLRIVANDIQMAFGSAFFVVLRQFGKMLDGMATAMNESGLGQMLGLDLFAGRTGDVNERQTAFMKEMNDELAKLVERQKAARDAASAPLESIQKIRDLLASMKEERITLPDILGAPTEEDEGGGLGDKLKNQEEKISEHMARIRALTKGGLSDKLGAWGDYFTNLVSLSGTSSKKLLSIAKSFGAAQALVNAWQAHNAVLAAPGLPWWMRAATAAQTLAAGLGAVNAIRAVGEGGGGAGAAAGGGAAGGAAAGGQEALAQQPAQVLVNLHGPDSGIGRAYLSGLADRLQEEFGDRGYVLAVRA